MKTWSAPGLCVRKTGPAVVGVGATVNYRIQVSNPGDVAAENVVVVDEIPDTMTLVGTNPPAPPTGRTLQWQLGRLGPGACQAINVSLRAERPGSAASCAEATANGGLKARECVTTTIAAAAVAAPLSLKITGPDQAAVGSEVTYEILITNSGDTTYNDLVIKDRFDAGFQHAKAASPIEPQAHAAGPANPRRSTSRSAWWALGGTCHTVELINQGVVVAERGLSDRVRRPPATPPATPVPEFPAPGQTQPAQPAIPTSPPAVSIRITGAKLRNVGERETYEFLVVNTGGQTLTNVNVVSDSSRELQAEQATSGYEPRGDNALVWKVRSLMPGRSQTFQVLYRMLQPAKEACLRARVTTEQGVQNEDKFCLEIRGAAAVPSSGLELKVTSLHNPTRQGKESTFVIQVTNNGQTPESNVVLTATVPPRWRFVRFSPRDPWE